MSELSQNTRRTVVAPTFSLVGDSLYGLFVRHIKAPVYDWRFLQGGIDGIETPEQAALRELREETLLDITGIPHQFVPGRFSVTEGGMPRAPEGSSIKLPKEYINKPILFSEPMLPLAKPNYTEKVGSVLWQRIDADNKYAVFNKVKQDSRIRLEIQLGEAIGQMAELGMIPEQYTYKNRYSAKS